MTEQSHPSESELLAFLEGRLRLRQFDPIVAHVEGCAACAGRLAQLETAAPADPLLQQVRRAVLPEVDDGTPVPAAGCWPAFLQRHPRFAVRGLISHGSRGPAYFATDRTTSGDVVLKWIAADAGAVDRLTRLVRQMPACADPRLIPTTHVEAVGAGLLIANEYRPGTTLREIVCSRGRLAWAETLTYAGRAAGALTLAHERGLTHGDLTPADWWIGESGLAIRGWDRPRSRREVTHDPKADVAGFGRTLLGLLVGQTTLTERGELPFDEIWKDVPGEAVAVLRATAGGEFGTVAAATEALLKAAQPKGWRNRWTPFRL